MQIHSKLGDVASQYSLMARELSLGYSHEGRPMKAIKVSGDSYSDNTYRFSSSLNRIYVMLTSIMPSIKTLLTFLSAFC